MTQTAADIIENARRARTFNECAGEAPIPDELLVRASIAYGFMERQGWIAPPKDNLDLPHAICQIAVSFADQPASTTERAKLIATSLDTGKAPEADAPAPVDPRQMSLTGVVPLDPRVASIIAFLKAEAGRFDRAADDFDGVLRNDDAADRCRVRAAVSRTLAAQIERGDDLLEGTAAPAAVTEPRQWQRGDLVLVDGDKEGCIASVRGNVAQVSLWDRAPAVVNVSRLSPLEPPRATATEPEEDPEVGALIEAHQREQAARPEPEPDIKASVLAIPESIGTQARETIQAAAERFKAGEDDAAWKVGFLNGQITLHPDGNQQDRDTVRMSGEQFAGLLGQCHQNGAMMAISAVGKLVAGDES